MCRLCRTVFPFHSFDWFKSLKRSYIIDTFPLHHHCSVHLNQTVALSMEEKVPSKRWNNTVDRPFSNTSREILKTSFIDIKEHVYVMTSVYSTAGCLQTMFLCGNKMPTRCNRGFIADLIACSTCFGHHYAHHQELKSIIQWLLPMVFRAVIFKLPVRCGAEGYVSGLQDAAASCKPAT